MTTFLNLIAAEPDIARVPIMMDSSKWAVIEAGLKCVQGKAIVNSITLKEGEEKFLQQAGSMPPLRRGGGGDGLRREGPGRDATTRKVAICARAYGILTEKVGFPPEDIIFDPEHLHHRHRHGGARQLRGRLHQGDTVDQGSNLPHAKV